MNSEPLVSVVIPSLNSEETLSLCLESVKSQSYKNIEIIVVDAGSYDNTAVIGLKFDAKVINANIKNMAKQTNIGAQNSMGKYIYRLDSDVVLSETVVEECVYKCEIEDCDSVATYWGPEPSISFWAKVRKLEKDCYKYDRDRNVSRFYKRSLFEKIGGYNEDIVSGEDYDIQNRIVNNNYKTGFAESEGFHLGEPKTINQIIKSNYHYGKTVKHFLKQNKAHGAKQMGPIRWSLIKNWKNFLKKPFLTLGFAVYYVIIYSSTFLGIFYSFMRD